jgi:P-type E1-E2 ATPase
MAFSIDTMKKDQLLIKKVAACETLGCVKDICTGKTGTLTKNEQYVKKYFVGGKTYNCDQYNQSLKYLDHKVHKLITECLI